MSLKLRIALIMGAAILLMVAINAAVLQLLISRSFTQLEEGEAASNSNRVANAIDQELAHMGRSAVDWAVWDESYDFVTRSDPDYVDRNLMQSAFAGLGVDLMCFYDREGQLVWGKAYDPETGEEMALAPFQPNTLPANDLLLSHDDAGSAHDGVLVTERGPMLVVSRPVLRTNGVGAIGGTIVLGRLLNAAQLAAMRDQVAVDFEILHGPQLPAFESDFRIETLEDYLVSYQLLPDLYGNPILAVASRTPREISGAGERTVQISILSVLVIGVLELLVLWVLLQSLVLRPVTTLTAQVARIGDSGSPEDRVPEESQSDEFRVLAHAFNRMLERLAEAREQLVEQSHRAGMAEMAAGVLHNLRNGLNPLVSRVDALNSKLLDAPGADLQRAIDEMKNGQTAAARKDRLVDYVGLTAAALLRLRDAAVVELSAVSSLARKLGDIINSQDKFLYTSSVVEPVRLVDSVRDALSLLPAELQHDIDIEVGPSVEALAPAEVERIGLMQVLHNLVVNAAESIARSGRRDGRVTIFAVPEAPGTVHLAIADNGVGIDPSRLEEIFRRGYTSKKGGKGGLGLHWCANAVANMRGRLYAESSPNEEGAVFHLLLPAQAERMAA